MKKESITIERMLEIVEEAKASFIFNTEPHTAKYLSSSLDASVQLIITKHNETTRNRR